MAKHLDASGWAAIVVAAGTAHPSGRRRISGWWLRRRGREDGVEYVLVNVLGYRGNGVARILNMFSFTLGALLPGMMKGLERPDVVIGSTVHPLAAWAGLRLAKRKGAKFVYEIRDIWPETLVDLGHLEQQSWQTRLMAALSAHLSRNASLVISPLPRVDRYLSENGLDRTEFLWVANGSDRKAELPAVAQPKSNGFVLMYLGAHGNANALDLIIDAFAEFSAENPDARAELRFVGDGPLKPKMIEYVESKNLSDRVRFLPPVARERVFEVAQDAHCLVAAMYKKPIYAYGVGMNKISDYMMCGRPVVYAAPSVDDNPIATANAGLVVAAGDRSALADAFGSMLKMSSAERESMARNGQCHVVEEYTYDVLAARLAAGLNAVVDGRPQPRV